MISRFENDFSPAGTNRLKNGFFCNINRKTTTLRNIYFHKKIFLYIIFKINSQFRSHDIYSCLYCLINITFFAKAAVLGAPSCLFNVRLFPVPILLMWWWLVGCPSLPMQASINLISVVRRVSYCISFPERTDWWIWFQYLIARLTARCLQWSEVGLS